MKDILTKRKLLGEFEIVVMTEELGVHPATP